MQREIHTPEGMRDIYNGECRRKRVLQQNLMNVLNSYGYEEIETPIIEYFDVFSKEVGTISSRDLYKFFDRVGDTLVLRPDFTPSIARAVSMYFGDEKLPIRLCYQGKTFENRSSYQGRLNESTQIGVEFLGDSDVYADSEIIALAVEELKAAGLKEFQISIGEVNYFKALVKEAGFDDDTEKRLRKCISNKNIFGVEELVERMHMDDKLYAAFKAFPQLFGGIEILDKAASFTDNESALKAVDRLRKIYEVLKSYGVEDYVSFDLSMLSKYRYYTGIIFQGFTYGSGEAILKGGRYDSLLGHFGTAMPAVGFGIVIEQMMNALMRQSIEIPVDDSKMTVFYAAEDFAKALELAKTERAKGRFVSLVQRQTDWDEDTCNVMAAAHDSKACFI